MELDKNTRKFLKQVKKLEPDFNNGAYSYKLIAEKLKMKDNDIFRICAFLKLQGLIEYEKGFNKLNMGIKFTQEGTFYKEFEFMKQKEKFIWCIVVPIFVAIITAIIFAILLLCAYLPLKTP